MTLRVVFLTTKENIKTTILALLEKYSADDLTVKMVCMECGISKQTLYNHFRCIMDAVEEAYADRFYSAVTDCDTYVDWVEGFRCTLYMLHSNKSISLHLYNSSHRDEFICMIRKYGTILVKRGIEDCSRDMGIEIKSKDREFMLEFYMYVFMGIVENYLQNKMREDPEYIAGRCDAMMRFHIRCTLRNMRDLENGEF